MKAVRRYQIADYIMVGSAFALMGVGFNTLDESPNANIDRKTYVNERNSSVVVTHYEPQFPFDADFIEDEDAVKALYSVGRDRKTGEDAQFEYVRVELFEADSSGAYPARKFTVAAEVTDLATGEGGEIVKLSGNLHQIGDHVAGKFDPSTKTFTANS